MSKRKNVYSLGVKSDKKVKVSPSTVRRIEEFEDSREDEEEEECVDNFFDDYDPALVKSIYEFLSQLNKDTDPPIVFIWRDVKVFLAAATAFPPDTDPPFNFPATDEEFKSALMHLVAPNPLAVHLGGVIACTQPEFATACGNLGLLCSHPWFIAVHTSAQNAGVASGLPLAVIATPQARTSRLARALNNNLPGIIFAPLWG